MRNTAYADARNMDIVRPMKKAKKDTSEDSEHLVPFPMRIDPELLEDLKRLAERDDRPVSTYVRRVLKSHVAKELKK